MTRRFIPEFTSQWKIVSVGAVRCDQSGTSNRRQMAHRISFVTYHRCGEARVTMLPLRLTTRTFTRMRHTPQLGGSSPNLESLQDTETQGPRALKARGQHKVLGSDEPRTNKFLGSNEPRTSKIPRGYVDGFQIGLVEV